MRSSEARTRGSPGVFARAAATLVLALPACAGADAPLRALEGELGRQIAAGGAEVSVYFRDLAAGDSLLISPDRRMHAASTMKVPVMIQLFLDRDAGKLDLDDSTTVGTTFHSIVDGSAFEMAVGSDSETELYGRLGAPATLRELNDLMITVSSNLATNILIELLGATRVTATMRGLGADSIEVLRGVEDLKAFEAGLSNSVTARDLGVIMTALARQSVGSPESAREMIEVLKRQRFREKIPAGVGEGAVVANKTGDITRVSHDAAIVYPPGREPYVLVVLTRGIEDPEVSATLVADLSRAVYRHVVGTADGDG